MILDFVKASLAEDVGRGDLYARIAPATPATANIIAKSDGVLAGQLYCNALCELETLHVTWHYEDSQGFKKGDTLATLSADSHTLLKIERTFLNMLLHSSSIATLTNQYVELIRPFGTKLLDTRKTRPLLRNFEKYSTRTGGAINHRMGLDDSLMLKDTHLKTIDNLEEFILDARRQIPFTSKIEIEAETFEQAKEFMALGADIVMCDNMSPEQLETIVSYRNENHLAVLLEASGNINLETIVSYAKTGVDAISSGSLIHQANWIDLSMKVQ
ncbi:MAG: carboxylating nicotinate-nucleotide diphosphorylase [Campylobacterota bacterium]|nr:carboxylating nicotinate-nucleotide diphosphorylase [Campylobacterota bacterium]